MNKQLLIVILFLFSVSVFSQLKVGDVAPAIPKLKIINNEFPNLENKYIFLYFWATYNSSGVRYLSHLNTLALRFKKSVIYLAVTDENEENIQRFLQDKQWNYIFFGLDEEGIYYKNFSPETVPVFYLISPDHIILSSGVTNELKDYMLDSILNKADSKRQFKINKLNDLNHK